ncbi:MAG: hypothetical protein K0R70_86, partial [Steroidobacteraceae bacterium]|nr:hypothetical protein [Steroidobacteraceae bacterium]
DPPMNRAIRVFATAQLTLAILGAVPLLWFAEEISRAALLAGALAIVAVLWTTGAVMQGRVRLGTALALEAVALVALAWAGVAGAAATLPVIRDDATVQRAVERARTAFLRGQSFDRMQVSVLVEDEDGHWRRGAVEGDATAYPASTVKLGFLVGAVHWCREQGRAPACLDEFVRPMIVDSDNVATGEVVDRISGVVNGPLEGADLARFIKQRRYTERVLDAAGLLGPQRLFTKTYPTNSGEEPAGIERVAWQQLGRNAMTPNLTAALLLGVVSGALEPESTNYMRSLLRRPTFSAFSALGGGLPPGTQHENKVGSAFDTLQDAMYAELPNGRRLIVAAFTNGWEATDPPPGDVATLGDFTARLLRELRLDRGLERPTFVESRRIDQDALTWRWRTRKPGRYEIALWHEAAAGNATRLRGTLGGVDLEVDLTQWGARWIRLADVELERGTTVLRLDRQSPGALVEGTLRVTRWPDSKAP